MIHLNTNKNKFWVPLLIWYKIHSEVKNMFWDKESSRVIKVLGDYQEIIAILSIHAMLTGLQIHETSHYRAARRERKAKANTSVTPS